MLAAAVRELRPVYRLNVFSMDTLAYPRQRPAPSSRHEAPEIEAFLTMLSTERKVAAYTHWQALIALLYLDKEALAQKLPCLSKLGRLTTARRITSVLKLEEVQLILALTRSVEGLLTSLLFGTGIRQHPRKSLINS